MTVRCATSRSPKFRRCSTGYPGRVERPAVTAIAAEAVVRCCLSGRSDRNRPHGTPAPAFRQDPEAAAGSAEPAGGRTGTRLDGAKPGLSKLLRTGVLHRTPDLGVDRAAMKRHRLTAADYHGPTRLGKKGTEGYEDGGHSRGGITQPRARRAAASESPDLPGW